MSDPLGIRTHRARSANDAAYFYISHPCAVYLLESSFGASVAVEASSEVYVSSDGTEGTMWFSIPTPNIGSVGSPSLRYKFAGAALVMKGLGSIPSVRSKCEFFIGQAAVATATDSVSSNYSNRRTVNAVVASTPVLAVGDVLHAKLTDASGGLSHKYYSVAAWFELDRDE